MPPFMRQIVFSAQIDSGFRSAGELLDHLDSLDPAERRKLLNKARVDVGLEDTDAVDARRRIETEITRVHLDPGLQVCHAADCNAMPLTETGGWRSVRCRRWFCAAHEHLADPGDLDDLGTGVKLSPAGVLVPDIPAEDEREAAADESRRRQQQARHADRAADADAEHQQARREQLARELPEHLRNAI